MQKFSEVIKGYYTSDETIEKVSNKFPNINIPIGNNFASGNDNFGFPNLKNE